MQPDITPVPNPKGARSLDLDTFETHRTYLFSIAYRMLGSAADAEDAVQETYLRSQSAAPGEVRSPKAYLATIITRHCMDQLQLARRTREVYVGPWLPEPILTASAPETLEASDPAVRVEAQESISLAFMVLLEQLQPFERAVFLLRQVFVYEFAEIAEMLGKSESACRRSFSRARAHLRSNRPRYSASPQTHRQLLVAYLRAVETGEMSTLMNVLSETVVLWTDGGGKTVKAALLPIYGPDNVARLSVSSTKIWPADYQAEFTEVNGQLAIIVRSQASAFAVVTIEANNDKIEAVRIIANPEKLTHI